MKFINNINYGSSTASSVDGDEMDKLIAKVADQDFVTQAFWGPSNTD
jgi:putative Mg2+ transporter-C (MgtC) family protein